MRILEMSKEKKEAIVRISADELILIANVFYRAIGLQRLVADNRDKIHSEDITDGFLRSPYEMDENFCRLYSDISMFRDLCQYGALDSFSFGQISKYRKLSEEAKQ